MELVHKKNRKRLQNQTPAWIVTFADLATLLSQWGDGVSCDPQPTYPCFDLGNLNLPAVAMN